MSWSVGPATILLLLTDGFSEVFDAKGAELGHGTGQERLPRSG